jgi:hypothetical protein
MPALVTYTIRVGHANLFEFLYGVLKYRLYLFLLRFSHQSIFSVVSLQSTLSTNNASQIPQRISYSASPDNVTSPVRTGLTA